MRRKRNIAATVVVTVVLAIAFLVARFGQKLPSSVFETDASSPVEAEAIPWQDADQHYGEVCTVRGEIVATYNSGSACFLNFHNNWQNHLTAVIFAEDFGRFPLKPEQYYRGKTVLVSGRIEKHKGAPEIILESPAQVQIVDKG